jgi:proteasome beta subunit
MPDEAVAEIADRVIGGRMRRPDGPVAPLTTPAAGEEA